MNNKKYEILMDKENTIEFGGRILHRIRALKDFRNVRKGDIGGYVENEHNLSQEGDCWIYDDAKAMDNSYVCDDAIMFDDSRMFDDSEMRDYSIMCGNSSMYGHSALKGKYRLYGKLFSKVDDFVEINNPQGRLVTCVRKGDKILYNIGCQREIDEQTFKDRIENEDGGLEGNPHRKYYYKIIEMAKLYFGVK